MVAVVGVAAVIASAGFGTPALRPVGVALVAVAGVSVGSVELAARNLRISRSLEHQTVTAGEPIRATLRLSGWAPRSGLMRMLDWDAHVAGPAGTTETPMRTQRSAGDLVHHVMLGAVPRGEHTLGPPWVGIGDPFGLVRVRRAVRSSSTVLAVARTVPVGLPFWEGATRRTGDNLGRARGRVELSGIRDYEPGDPLSLIHWGQTARRGRLQTKELHGESGRGRRLMVVLDTMASDEPAAERDFEVAVSAAASLVAGCAARGTAVGLVLGSDPSQRWPVASPVASMERALALTTQAGSEPVDVIVRSLVNASDSPDLIVVISTGAAHQLPSAVGAARTAGITTAAVLIGPARGESMSVRRAGAIVAEAANFDQLSHALDLMAVHA